MVPSFPNTVWDGTSSSRPNSTFAPPTAFDWDRLVGEVQAMQSLLLGQVGTQVFVSLEPDNYTAAQTGLAVNVDPDGKSWKAIIGTGLVNGDTSFTVSVEEAESESGNYLEIVSAPIITTADQVEVVSFVPTKPWIRIKMLEGGEDSDGHAYGLFVKGNVPSTLFNAIMANNYTSTAVGTGIDFGAVDGKQVIGFAALGSITGDSQFTVSFEESSDDMTYVDIPNATMPKLFNDEETAIIKFSRTRKYVRATVTMAGMDSDGHIVVTMGRV